MSKLAKILNNKCNNSKNNLNNSNLSNNNKIIHKMN